MPRVRPRVADPPVAGLAASSFADWGVESPSASPIAHAAQHPQSGRWSAPDTHSSPPPAVAPRPGRGALPMSLTTRFPAARKLCDEVQASVDELVTGRDAGPDRESAVAEKVNALSAEVAALKRSLATDALGRQEAWQQCGAGGRGQGPPTGAGLTPPRGRPCRRVANVEAESQALRRTLERHLSHAFRQASEEREREQLLAGHVSRGSHGAPAAHPAAPSPHGSRTDVKVCFPPPLLPPVRHVGRHPRLVRKRVRLSAAVPRHGRRVY